MHRALAYEILQKGGGEGCFQGLGNIAWIKQGVAVAVGSLDEARKRMSMCECLQAKCKYENHGNTIFPRPEILGISCKLVLRAIMFYL
jgi:hypothetical protein